MKVINISTKLTGGAGLAAKNFHQNLCSNGHTSVMINEYENDKKNNIFKINSNFLIFLKKLISKTFTITNIFKADYFYYYNFFELNFKKNNIKKFINFKPDYIVLHSIQNFTTINDIYFLAEKYKAKIYWMIYDMGPFTGGCHYSWKCMNYQFDCRDCNAINFNFLKNISNSYFRKKQLLINDLDISSLSSSEFLLNQISSSTLFKDKKNYLLNLGIDENNFFKIYSSNLSLRKKYNVNFSKKIFLFATPDLMVKRKGISLLKKALKYIDENYYDSFAIMTIGKLDPNYNFGKGIKHFHFKPTNSIKILNELYNISDYFLCPSIEDSGNTMLIQSLLTGLPYISFEIAYGLDLKKENIGLTIKNYDVEKFAKAIIEFINLNKSDYDTLSEKCIKISKNKYSLNTQLKNFIKITELEK